MAGKKKELLEAQPDLEMAETDIKEAAEAAEMEEKAEVEAIVESEETAGTGDMPVDISGTDAAPDEAFTGEAEKSEASTAISEITKEVAESFQKEAIIEDAFIRRSITLPNKRARRETFREEETIVGDESGEIETFSSMKRKEYGMLADSAKSAKPKVLYGRVDGVEEIEAGGMRSAMVICHLATDIRSDLNTEREMRSGIYKIKIPAPMFFIYNREEYATQEGYPQLKKNLDMRIGSIAEFVVYDINMAQEDVLASRIRAMQILGYDNYLSEKAQVKPGVIAKGYIAYINSRGIVVDILGSDCFIPNDELSWKFIGNALDERKNFQIGTAVPVRIKSVEKASAQVYGRNYPYIKTTGSIKDAKQNPNKVFYEKYVLGQKYKGTIAYKLVTGEYIVNLGSAHDGISGDGATCICKAPAIEFSGSPYVGQNCMVAIVGKNKDNYRFSGAFTYLE